MVFSRSNMIYDCLFQLEAGYMAFYEQAVKSDASGVTGDDLINLGVFVCGVGASNYGFSSASYQYEKNSKLSLRT